MPVFIECICGKKFQVDRSQVETFDCEGCGRKLDVPKPALEQRLIQIRERMKQGDPGMREAMRKAAEMRIVHAVPLLKEGAQSGVREAVNAALVGMVDYPPGQDVITEWIRQGALSLPRLTNALSEEKYDKGVDFVCGLVQRGLLQESQVAEVAPWLGDSGSARALETLRGLRRKHPNLGGILDQALSRLRSLDQSAGSIPDEAKRIPGRAPSGVHDSSEAPQKKGCFGMLLAILAVLGMLAAALV